MKLNWTAEEVAYVNKVIAELTRANAHVTAKAIARRLHTHVLSYRTLSSIKWKVYKLVKANPAADASFCKTRAKERKPKNLYCRYHGFGNHETLECK